ncbi:MAG TPA: ATP synthase F0 subunit B [Terriglobia bacterium]|nr:ATP synthase F0 subunit B [Terriglobia bacterium]
MIKLDYTLFVTIFYVVVLYAFMTHFFFKPIVRVLHERRRLIEGRIQAAQQSVAEADRKAGEYENALKAARSETFRRQETQREQALTERTELLSRTKTETEKTVQQARVRLLSEAEAASNKLDAEVDSMARQLTTSLLQDRT